MQEKKEPFETWIKNFDNIKNVLEQNEWKEIYSKYYEFTKDELNINLNENVEEMEKYTNEQINEEIEKCSNNFFYFCSKYIKIKNYKLGLINFIPYSYQRKFFNSCEKNKINVSKKFRQGGFSTLLLVIALWKAKFKSNKTLVLSPNYAQSEYKFNIIKEILNNLPKWLRFNEEASYLNTDMNICNIKFTTSGIIKPEYNNIIIDEAAFLSINNLNTVKNYLNNFSNYFNSAIIVSTLNPYNNFFENFIKETKNNFIEVNYWENKEFNDPEFKENYIKTLGQKYWDLEFEKKIA